MGLAHFRGQDASGEQGNIQQGCSIGKGEFDETLNRSESERRRIPTSRPTAAQYREAQWNLEAIATDTRSDMRQDGTQLTGKPGLPLHSHQGSQSAVLLDVASAKARK